MTDDYARGYAAGLTRGAEMKDSPGATLLLLKLELEQLEEHIGELCELVDIAERREGEIQRRIRDLNGR